MFFLRKFRLLSIMLVFQSEPVVSKSSLSSTFLKVLGMQRFIGGMTIGIFCLQWSLPVSASNPTCEPVDKLAQPLVSTGSFVTQVATDTASYFRLRCSCNADDGEMLAGTASLRIIDPKIVRNGSATISSENSGDVEEINKSMTITTLTPGVFEAELSYYVKVSALDGGVLESGNYSVTVQFNGSPQCITGLG
jgi:hypothetical protein